MDLLFGGILFALQIAIGTPAPSRNTSLLCHECFHVTFSSNDPGAIIPEDTVNKECLKEGEDYTYPDVLMCEPDVSYCRKVVGQATMMYKGHEIIADINARECGAEGNDTICRNDDYYIRSIFEQKKATIVRVDAQACFCDWDKCNSGHTMHLSLYLALTLMFFMCAF